MSAFRSPDLIPLWDRPPEFLPLRPTGGAHHWRYITVRQELEEASKRLDKKESERRVALLAHPGLANGTTAEGVHAGIQLLLPGESAAPHRHTPAALRVGLESTEIVTTVDNLNLRLDPLDVVLNPSGTWHGHVDLAGAGGAWLDVVDLPLVSALGGVLFEPQLSESGDGLLDPPMGVPATVRFPWSETLSALTAGTPVDGVRTCHYGDGSVLPTLAVTAYSIDQGATMQLPARTAAAVVLAGQGSVEFQGAELGEFDVVSLRSWTPASFTSRTEAGIVMVIDTSPATKRLGLYREERTA